MPDGLNSASAPLPRITSGGPARQRRRTGSPWPARGPRLAGLRLS